MFSKKYTVIFVDVVVVTTHCAQKLLCKNFYKLSWCSETRYFCIKANELFKKLYILLMFVFLKLNPFFNMCNKSKEHLYTNGYIGSKGLNAKLIKIWFFFWEKGHFFYIYKWHFLLVFKIHFEIKFKICKFVKTYLV